MGSLSRMEWNARTDWTWRPCLGLLPCRISLFVWIHLLWESQVATCICIPSRCIHPHVGDQVYISHPWLPFLPYPLLISYTALFLSLFSSVTLYHPSSTAPGLPFLNLVQKLSCQFPSRTLDFSLILARSRSQGWMTLETQIEQDSWPQASLWLSQPPFFMSRILLVIIHPLAYVHCTPAIHTRP